MAAAVTAEGRCAGRCTGGSRAGAALRFPLDEAARREGSRAPRAGPAIRSSTGTGSGLAGGQGRGARGREPSGPRPRGSRSGLSRAPGPAVRAVPLLRRPPGPGPEQAQASRGLPEASPSLRPLQDCGGHRPGDWGGGGGRRPSCASRRGQRLLSAASPLPVAVQCPLQRPAPALVAASRPPPAAPMDRPRARLARALCPHLPPAAAAPMTRGPPETLSSNLVCTPVRCKWGRHGPGEGGRAPRGPLTFRTRPKEHAPSPSLPHLHGQKRSQLRKEINCLLFI
nr:translation initiation factor IF-2-like [Equus asinus]